MAKNAVMAPISQISSSVKPFWRMSSMSASVIEPAAEHTSSAVALVAPFMDDAENRRLQALHLWPVDQDGFGDEPPEEVMVVDGGAHGRPDWEARQKRLREGDQRRAVAGCFGDEVDGLVDRARGIEEDGRHVAARGLEAGVRDGHL